MSADPPNNCAIMGEAPAFGLDANGGLVGSSRVYKVGRTTGYTEGVVTHIGGTASINYGAFSAYFAGQIVVKPTVDNGGPFSNRGDSGSCVLNDSHLAVGLLFAGSPLQTLANPMGEVLKALTLLVPTAKLVHL